MSVDSIFMSIADTGDKTLVKLQGKPKNPW